jgi:DNA-binding NarL/FixJ family response regulator
MPGHREVNAYAELVSGQIALWKGRPAEAALRLERALHRLTGAADPVARAVAQLHLAVARSLLGQPAAAAALARECRILYDAAYPVGWFARYALHHVATVPPRRSPVPPVLASLSPREREVAALVTQGLSDRQISEQLVISRRTAESHVSRILTKLGLSSRVQVATLVAGQRRGR